MGELVRALWASLCAQCAQSGPDCAHTAPILGELARYVRAVWASLRAMCCSVVELARYVLQRGQACSRRARSVGVLARDVRAA